MTTINSQEDFLRALDENPQWLEAVRSRILDDELRQMPARFNAFVERTETFMERTEGFMHRTEELWCGCRGSLRSKPLSTPG